MSASRQAQREKQSTVQVSIDAENAFDCVNWKFLCEVLERFEFNNKSVWLIKTQYQKPSVRIKINGNLTEKIWLVNQAGMLFVANPICNFY